MAKIPYPPDDTDELREVVQAIRERRGGGLLNLDRMLLHSPPLAQGWNRFVGTVRSDLALAPKLRELAMCAVAVVNYAAYEFEHHAPEFIKAGGAMDQLKALLDIDAAAADQQLFDAAEAAVLQLTLEMSRYVAVSDATFQAAQAAMPDERHLVELIGVISAYNMVSRFLVAMDIDQEPKDSV
jgi:alkylhydroperoxidase family enzyme